MWSKPRCFGHAGRNVSRLVELGRNIDILVAPVETYLAVSYLVKTLIFCSRRSKSISLGRTLSKYRFFARAGRKVSRLVEISQKLDVLVAPVKTYLTWSNLVKT